MKRAVILTLCMLLLAGASSFATNTRVLTMGENNTILLDEANISLYPGRTFQYPDIALAEFSYRSIPDFRLNTDATVAQFGVHWKFGKDNPWVLGTYLYNNEAQIGDEAYLGGFNWPARLDRIVLGGSYYLDAVSGIGQSFLFSSGIWGQAPTDLIGFDGYSNRRVGLFYGRQLGGNDFGFSFDYLHSGWSTVVDGQDEDEMSFRRFVFGLGMTDDAGLWDIGAHLQLIGWKDKEFATPAAGGTPSQLDATKPSGNLLFDIQGRYFYEYNPMITFVPHAGFVFGKFETEDYQYGGPDGFGFYATPETEKLNVLSFDVGSGMHYSPSAGVLAVIDVGVNYLKADFESNEDDGTGTFQKYEFNTKVFSLPYLKLGFEGEVWDWLTARFGATSYWRNWKFEDPEANDEEKWNFPSNETYLGLGFNFGRLHIDTYTDPELFLNGFDFITGSGASQMNFQLSVLYDI